MLHLWSRAVKGSFYATPLSHGPKQLHLAPYDATLQTPSFLPFFPFWTHFTLSSSAVLTVLEEGTWCFPPASAAHALRRLTWACPHHP